MSLLKDLKSSLKDIVIYSLGNLSTKIIGFILIPLYTEYLSVEDYAILALLDISVQFMTAVFGLRLSAALLRLFWDEKYLEKQKSMFFTSLIFITGVCILMVIGLVIFSEPLSIFLFDSNNYQYLIQIMSFASGLQIISFFCLTLIRIKEKPILYTLSNLVKLTGTLILTIYFIVYLNKNVEAIYEAQIVGSFLLMITIASFMIKNLKLKFDIQILQGMLSYSLPLILAEISGTVFTITSRYCLKFLSTLYFVGVFSLGHKVSNTLYVFVVSSVMLAINPLIFKKMNDPDCKRFYSKIMTYFSFGLMIFVLAISMFGRELILLLTRNKDYWDAHTVIPLLSFAIFFGMLKDVSLTGLHISKKTNYISFIVTFMTIINLILNIILIPIWQSIGAALATLIAQIIFFSLIYITAQRFYFIPYEIKKVLKIIFIGSLMFTVSFLFKLQNIFTIFIFKSALIFMFPLLLYLWNFYEEIELIRLRQSWHKWKNPSKWKSNLNM